MMLNKYGIVSLLLLFALAGCGDKPDDKADSDSDDADTADTTQSSARDDSDADSDDIADKGPLGIESGMVEYQLEGMMTGTITKYWRNYGAETAEYHDTSVNMMGFVQADKKWIIMTTDTIYTIDTAAGTATSATNPGKAMMGDMNRDQMQAFGKEMLQKMGKRDGEMEIAGKTCEKWVMTQMGSDVCLWEGIDIYSSSNMAGMGMTRTAISIKTGSVDDKHFELPDDIQVTDMGNPMDWQKKMQKAQDMMQQMPQMPQMPQ